MTPAPINTPSDGNCGYVAFYSGRRVEVYANTLYEAKQRVVKHLKVPPKREHMVSVMLAEVGGKGVTHVADF